MMDCGVIKRMDENSIELKSRTEKGKSQMDGIRLGCC